MKAIVVVDQNWGIGKDGHLLVHLPGDLRHFKEKTLGKTIIVGRKTLESFPGGKPLPGRNNIVLTENKGAAWDGCQCCHGEKELLEQLKAQRGDDLFVAGGACIYEMLLPHCDEVFVTRIHQSYEADRFFPNLEADPEFVRIWQSPVHLENGVEYRFETYKRK